MKEQTARAIEVHGDLQLDDAYYGRGCSKSTFALIGSIEELMASIASYMDDLVADLSADMTEEQRLEVIRQHEETDFHSLRSIRMDNLGSELIFY